MEKSIYNLGRSQKIEVNKEELIPDGSPIRNKERKKERKEIKNTEKYERFENPIQSIYEASERALKNIKVFPDDPYHEPFYVKPEHQNEEDGYVDYFKTIRIDTGEFERIMFHEDISEMEDVVFPAIFIRFVNIRWLVAQQRIGEGRAIMRVRYILNNENSTDPFVETMPFRLQDLINRTMQYAKKYEPSFDERLSLTFADMPERVGVLQPYWIDYEVWFRDISSSRLLDYKQVRVVVPPFTNHSDLPEWDIHNHGDHKTPTYDDSISIISKGGTNPPPKTNNEKK